MTMHNKILGAFAAGLFVVVAGGACTDPTPAAPADEALVSLGADQVIFGMVSYLTASGVREGRVQADTAYFFADSARVQLRGMNLQLFDENGRPRATVTSRSGAMDQNTDEMVARGDVVLRIHADGQVIESSELYYDPGRDRIWSDSATVRRLANGRVMRGTAFESDLEFRNVEVKNPQGAISGVRF